MGAGSWNLGKRPYQNCNGFSGFWVNSFSTGINSFYIDLSCSLFAIIIVMDTK